MTDSILSELWGEDDLEEGKVDFGAPYGIGTWPDAVLMEIEAQEAGDYGYSVKAVFNLKGDEGMRYTNRINLPRTVEENGDQDKYERSVKRESNTRKNLDGLLFGAGLLNEGRHLKEKFVVDTDVQYDNLMNILRHGVGRNMPIKVRQQQKFSQESGKWENTDFTRIEAIKPKGK